MTKLRRSCVRLLCGLALPAAVVISGTTPATAAPPVTVDDQGSMYEDQFKLFDVLDNDSDPDGSDDLALCRISPQDEQAPYFAWADGDQVAVDLRDVQGPAEIVITYYACDYETLVPGTLTINVKAIEPVRVVKAARPGRIRVTNFNDRRVTFSWGNFFIEQIDGQVRVAAHDTAVVRVHRRTVHWIAMFGYQTVVDNGIVHGVELPPGGRTGP